MANSASAAVFGLQDATLQAKLHSFYGVFIDEYRKVCKERNINPRATIYGIPHDSVVAKDRSTIFILSSPGKATDATSTDRYLDLTQNGDVQLQDLLTAANRDLGLQDITAIRFDLALLEKADPERRTMFRGEIGRALDQLLAKVKAVENLGIKEAATYLENARQRFNAGDPSGFSDSKSNCRNAITSLCKKLGGTDRVREAVRKMVKDGLLGEKEGDVVLAVENLVAHLHGLASKTGTHPPLADQNDALLTLRLTEAIVDYIATEAMRARGIA